MSYCKVNGCRYADTHVSSFHKCGKCNVYGHGQSECENLFLIEKLKIKSYGIYLPREKFCSSPTCVSPSSHTSDAHYCSQCGERHLESTCSNSCNVATNSEERQHTINEATKIFGNIPGKIFGTIYAGMGCQWFVKRDGLYGPIQLFFMHTDAWGQYGTHCDDRQKLVSFLDNYKFYENNEPFVLSK